MTITIQNLINALDAEKLAVQFLTTGECALTMRGGRNGINPTHLEVKFSSSPENMHREAIIVWVDRKDLSSAIDNLRVAPLPVVEDPEIVELKAALTLIMRAAEGAKVNCGSDPESPDAIRNGALASIAAVAAQGLGLLKGPKLSEGV